MLKQSSPYPALAPRSARTNLELLAALARAARADLGLLPALAPRSARANLGLLPALARAARADLGLKLA